MKDKLHLKTGIMDKSYFRTLNTAIKAELTSKCGELIITVETIDKIIALFLLDTFFVEIFINRKSNELEEIEVQDDDDVLYEYVRELDIHQLTD
jgi:hypothetical protein